MVKIDGKYGNVHIKGMSIDIEKTKISDLNKYLQKLEMKREQLIEQQNNYLSKIIN